MEIFEASIACITYKVCRVCAFEKFTHENLSNTCVNLWFTHPTLALTSRTASIAGYNVGVKVENKLNYYLNPTRDKYTWIDSGYLGISYQRKPSVIPSSVGNVFDSITSENITKDLNGNREGKK